MRRSVLPEPRILIPLRPRMHREFDPADQPFERHTNLSLYVLSAVVLVLVVLDFWPPLANWLAGSFGLELATFSSRELAGYRYALIAAVLGGARILYLSLERAVEGRIGADFAVALACIAAILLGEPLIAAEVIVISLVGECLEAITFDRTQNVLRKLVELFPTRIWILRDGQEVRAFANELVVGDTVLVKPGGKIPADGVVLDGRSSLDTSALTGESFPRDIGPGDSVLAGSVNLNGSLTIVAQKVARQTVAGQVIELTGQALRVKAPLERYADKLARRFLPVVLALAALTFAIHVAIQLGSRSPENPVTFTAAARVAFYPTLAVLVVACPCALVLATPAAVMAAIGRLAGTGVLLKGGAALERLASVSAIAFDKTGTLTEGRLTVSDVIPFGDSSIEDVLSLAAGAEARSEHPLAKAVLAAARERAIPADVAEEFQAHPGAGIYAKIAGETVCVGTSKFLTESGIALPQEWESIQQRLDSSGQSLLLVSRGGIAIGVIGTRDTLRPEAIGALADLAACGLSLALLTGDRSAVAKAIARDLPFDTIHPELLPAQKVEYLPPNAAFVGDGINDAPALASAAVGIAVGTGTDIAAEAGDIVLMGEPLRPLPLLVRLSRETVRVIRQNIVWFGFGVNIVGILIAGLLWPLLAATPDLFEKAPLVGVIYHQIGSLLVLLNSMRLLAFERESTGPVFGAIRDRYRAFDRWTNTVHLDDLFLWIEARWRTVLTGLAVALILVWLSTGLIQINADEVGVLQVFGAPRGTLNPGLHTRWPWPVETVTKLRPAEVRTVEIGFRRLSRERQEQLLLARAEQRKLRKPDLTGITDRDLTWASGHTEDVARLTDESLMITGDGNMVELLASVRYTLADPQQYLFGSREPEAIIRSQAEAVFRELVAGEVFLDLLTTRRQGFEDLAFHHLAKRLTETTSGTLGVALAGITLHDLHPPQEVVASYHAVAEAIQKRDRLINEAEADATRQRRRMDEEAMRIVRRAESDAAKTVADARASRDWFFAWHRSRTTLADSEENALRRELEMRVKDGADRGDVVAELDRRRAKILELRRALSEFRLGLTAATEAMMGRDKIMLDAADVPGKRQLFLADPDSFRIPATWLRPTEKDP